MVEPELRSPTTPFRPCLSLVAPSPVSALFTIVVVLSPSSPAHITKGPWTAHVQCGARWLGAGSGPQRSPGTIWEPSPAWPGLQNIQEMPAVQELSQFLRDGQILENSLGSRKTGLDSALRAARFHPLPPQRCSDSDRPMSTFSHWNTAVFLLALSLHAFGMEMS